MKSRITIEVDFDNGNLPVIQILQKQSDDVRDSLIQSFLQNLRHSSRWVRIEYIGERYSETPEKEYVWRLSPVSPDSLPDEINLMQKVVAIK